MATPEIAGHPAVIFFTLENKGKLEDRLLSVQTPVCGRAEIHDHIHENGVMKMRAVKGGIEIQPGQSIEFKPMGVHVMCFEPVLPQTPESSFRLNLIFESGVVSEAQGQIMTMAKAMRTREKTSPPPGHSH